MLQRKGKTRAKGTNETEEVTGGSREGLNQPVI